MTKKNSKTTKAAENSSCTTPKIRKAPDWIASLKPRKLLVAALEARDEQKVTNYRDELAAEREKRLALFDTMYSILDRPDFKVNPKPGMSLVRALVNEQGMSQFTANNRWQEFKSLVLNGEAE